MIVILFLMSLEIKIIMYQKDCAMDGILLSDLSACILDAKHLVDTLQVYSDEDGTINIRKMLEAGEAFVDSDKAYSEFQRLFLNNINLYGVDPKIESFIVYNVRENQVIADIYENETHKSEIGETGEWTTKNGIPIRTGTVYGCVSMEVKGIFSKRRVYIENGVSLRMNEDLQ